MEQGDTLGTVGNTGNARTTPPHLHFGVYRSGQGAVDPWWFIHSPRVTVPRLAVDTLRFGGWVRTRAEGVLLQDAPETTGDSGTVLPLHTAALVVAAVGSWYRVRLPDGEMGYLSATAAEPIEVALGVAAGMTSTELLSSPTAAEHPETVLASNAEPSSLAIHGRFGAFLLVRTPAGMSGWIRSDE